MLPQEDPQEAGRAAINRFLDVLNAPPDTPRTPEDEAFVRDFVRQRFHHGDGRRMSPKRIMEESPELWEAFMAWDAEQKKMSRSPAEAKTDKRDRQKEGKAKETGHDDEHAAHTPSTARGDVMQTLDAAGRLTDDQAYAMASRDTGERTLRRAGLVAKLSLATAMVVGGGLGVRAIVAAKKGAENIGNEVQQIQEKRGNYAIESGANPGTPIPGTQEAREAERRNQKNNTTQQKKGR